MILQIHTVCNCLDEGDVPVDPDSAVTKISQALTHTTCKPVHIYYGLEARNEIAKNPTKTSTPETKTSST